jgi:peptide/nickel transport system substrate-binding protein
LADAVPKQEIINSALSGFGQTVSGPLPPALTATTTINTKPDNASTTPPGQKLHAAGWTINDSVRTKDGETLSVTLKTVAIPSLEKAANLIQSRWEDIGVKVTTQTLPPNELTRQVLRPRDYEALLFGQSVGNLRDLYSFWHSSRQDDPGLNLAQYANTDVDQALETLRQATSSDRIANLRDEIISTITAEQPAAFVFSPSFIYVQPETVENTNLPPITQAADRFANISDWYTETKTLWNTFVDKQ